LRWLVIEAGRLMITTTLGGRLVPSLSSAYVLFAWPSKVFFLVRISHLLSGFGMYHFAAHFLIYRTSFPHFNSPTSTYVMFSNHWLAPLALFLFANHHQLPIICFPCFHCTLPSTAFPSRTGAFHMFVIIEHSLLTFYCTCIMMSSFIVIINCP
jgi:hypothetical protein